MSQHTPLRYDNIPGKNRYGFPHHLHRIAEAVTNIAVAELLYTGTEDQSLGRLIAKAPEMFAWLQTFINDYAPDARELAKYRASARALLREIEWETL